MLFGDRLSAYIYIYIYIYTHTHTHIFFFKEANVRSKK